MDQWTAVVVTAEQGLLKRWDYLSTYMAMAADCALCAILEVASQIYVNRPTASLWLSDFRVVSLDKQAATKSADPTLGTHARQLMGLQ